MNKKKIILAALATVCLSAGVAGIAACKTTHSHTYSEDWTSDETNHWHAATCEHSDEVKDLAAHEASDWTIVEEADCIHDGLEVRKCTVCDYVIESRPISATGVHDTDGVSGSCSVCGYLSAEAFDDLYDNLIDETVSVSGGSGTVTDVYGNVTEVSYEFGANYTHITTIDDSYQVDKWISETSDGELFYIRRDGADTAAYKDTYGSADELDGYGIYGILGSGYSYGVNNILDTVYAVATNSENAIQDLSVYYKQGVYSISFGYYVPGTDYTSDTYVFKTDSFYEVSVEFGLTNKAISSLNIVIDYYYNWYEVTNGKPSADNVEEFTIGDNGYCTPTTDEPSTETIEFTQTVGEATAVNPYSVEACLVTDYKLTYNGSEITDSVTVGASGWNSAILVPEVIAPSTASLNFEEPEISVEVYDAESQTWSDYSGFGFIASYSNSYGGVAISAYGLGTYRITITTVNTEKTVVVNLEKGAPTSLCAKVATDGTYSSANDVATATIIPGGAATFFATTGYSDATDAYMLDGYTAEITSANADSASLSRATEPDSNGKYVTTFTSTVPGTYEITLTSTENPAATATLIITVSEPKEVVLDGTYSAATDNLTYYVVFTPTDETSGSVQIYFVDPYDPDTYDVYYDYTYDDEAKTIQLSNKTGDAMSNYSLSVSVAGDLVLTDEYWNESYTLIAKKPLILDGTYSAATDNLTYYVVFTPTDETSGSVQIYFVDPSDPDTYDVYYDYTYNAETKTIQLSNKTGDAMSNYSLSVSVAGDLVLTDEYFNESYTLIAEKTLILDGTYAYDDGMDSYMAVFTPTDETSGSVTISLGDGSYASEYDYVYDPATKTFTTFTVTSGSDDYLLTVTTTGELLLTDLTMDNSFILSAPSKSWSGRYINGEYILKFDGDSTLSISYNSGNAWEEYTYTYDDESGEFTLSGVDFGATEYQLIANADGTLTLTDPWYGDYTLTSMSK